MLTAMFRDGFDLDLGLRDASLDAALSPTRRMIAAASLGLGIDDAYYSTRELHAAVAAVHLGEPDGMVGLTAILANRCDDYQRCLYFCLAGRGVVGMLGDLAWLEELLRARGGVSRDQRRRRLAATTEPRPYVADEPDGPVCAPGAFAQGASWWTETLPR